MPQDNTFDQLLTQTAQGGFIPETEPLDADTSVNWTPSRRHRIRMNRIFRELVQSSRLPHPEVDSAYERIRSGLIVRLRLTRFFYR